MRYFRDVAPNQRHQVHPVCPFKRRVAACSPSSSRAQLFGHSRQMTDPSAWFSRSALGLGTGSRPRRLPPASHLRSRSSCSSAGQHHLFSQSVSDRPLTQKVVSPSSMPWAGLGSSNPDMTCRGSTIASARVSSPLRLGHSLEPLITPSVCAQSNSLLCNSLVEFWWAPQKLCVAIKASTGAIAPAGKSCPTNWSWGGS